jgi:phage-related protein
MMPRDQLKPLVFVGSSRRDLRAFPDDVRHAIGLTLLRVQFGDAPRNVKPLRGFGGGVLEVIENDEGGTFRGVYTVKFAQRIYVLHAFQKKSKQGIKTPTNHLDLIKKRISDAREIHQAWQLTFQTPPP